MYDVCDCAHVFFLLRMTNYIYLCILYNQRDATYTMFFIIISALHVSDGISAHHQELIKLYVQPWVLSCFPAVYSWCGWFGFNVVDSGLNLSTCQTDSTSIFML